MHKLPAIKGKELVKFLKNINFSIVRTKGSHVRLKKMMEEPLPLLCTQKEECYKVISLG